jgi:hypothetical protein
MMSVLMLSFIIYNVVMNTVLMIYFIKLNITMLSIVVCMCINRHSSLFYRNNHNDEKGRRHNTQHNGI